LPGGHLLRNSEFLKFFLLQSLVRYFAAR
jgi:hypothetical protein